MMPALLLALVLPVSAALRVQAPGALHATPFGAWTASHPAPVLRAMELQGLTPQSFGALDETGRDAAVARAAAAVRAEAAQESRELIAAAMAADPDSPGFAMLAARLAELSGPLASFAPEQDRAQLQFLARTVTGLLPPHKQAELATRMSALANALAPTLVEQEAAALPKVPAALMTPGVNRLRAAAAKPAGGPEIASGPVFAAKVGYLRARHSLRSAIAQKVYRPVLMRGKRLLIFGGKLWRRYFTARSPDRHTFRWMVLSDLHAKKDFTGALGQPTYDGDAKVHSKLIDIPADTVAALGAQRHAFRDVRMSAGLGISGMSFPQLSAQAHLSLLHIDLMLAKEQGIRLLHNTGEGGPGLLLGLLEGNAEKIKGDVIAWSKANGQFKDGSMAEARVVQLVDALMKSRNELFKDFTKEDLARAQIVAQYGGAFNGIRRDDDESRVDFDKLARTAANPFVAMIQFKMKQAAKFGAKVDPSKVDTIVAAMREIPRNKSFKSPEVVADMGSAESVAALIRATRAVTDKPVSLKFAVGDVVDALKFMTYLRDADALPDHIQLDGAGPGFSPGSGNAPPGADTNLPIDHAIIAFDAILKKLKIRDRVFVDASGDILWPIDAVQKLALGADGVCAARGWMGGGVGCEMAKDCDKGHCPYGIASPSDALTGLSLDPSKVAPQGHKAMSNWHKEYHKLLARAGVTDLAQARSVLGLSNSLSPVHVYKNDWPLKLDEAFPRDKVVSLLRGALTPKEVDKLVYGK